ncbi:MAG: hypothetical protein ACLFP0_07865 [Rhodosalinus sp.]
MTAASATAATPAPIATLAPEELYWGLIAAPAPHAAAARRYRFEAQLPVPVETLHCVEHPLGDGRVVCVAIETERLRELLHLREDIDTGTWAVIPADAPPALHAAGVDAAACARLNLLNGDFEPLRRRRLRRAVAATWMLGLLLALGLAAFGSERRARAERRAAARIARVTSDAVAAAFPPEEGEAALPPESRLTQHLRRLRQAGDRSIDPTAANAIAGTLESLCQAWPGARRYQIATLTAAADRIILRGRAATSPDVEALARALDGVLGNGRRWRSALSSTHRQGEDFAFVVTLEPAGAPERP